MRIKSAIERVGTGADDEEGTCQIEAIEAGEVDVAAIHDVETADLQHENIMCLIIRAFAIGDVNQTGNIATQIE